MRYEDIKANPEQEIRRIADFLEITDLSDEEFSQVPLPQVLLFVHMVLCCGLQVVVHSGFKAMKQRAEGSRMENVSHLNDEIKF